MLEIPEAAVLSQQVSHSMTGKKVVSVIAAKTPHGFAWYYGDPQGYPPLLTGKTVTGASRWGGMVEMQLGDVTLVFSDGINLRHHRPGEPRPEKHQLLLEFEDGSALTASVAMYGGLFLTGIGENRNPYYLEASQKPSPLSPEFTQNYFLGLFDPESQKIPLKGFLASKQRIPGLGNGVLQDIVYNAGFHSKMKVSALRESDKATLYNAIIQTLKEMTSQGGRDTERDLFGNPGGYRTKLSKFTAGTTCPKCGERILKESYLGGSIYFCPGCQPLPK